MPPMARLPLVDPDDPNTDPAAREALVALRGRRGTVDPNVYRAIANHPEALRTMSEFGAVVYSRNSLPRAQRELAYLAASVTNDCHY
jgi:alkylhydroperoxidase family enzyme